MIFYFLNCVALAFKKNVHVGTSAKHQKKIFIFPYRYFIFKVTVFYKIAKKKYLYYNITHITIITNKNQ